MTLASTTPALNAIKSGTYSPTLDAAASGRFHCLARARAEAFDLVAVSVVDFTEDFMAERRSGRFAYGQTMLSQQFGNRPIGRALLPKIDDDFPGQGKLLELLRMARREFRDRLLDSRWVK